MTGRLCVRRLALVWVCAHGLAACGWGRATEDPRASAAETGRPAGGASDQSIYGLDLALTDERGQTRTLADLRGHVLVAAMMYTSCNSVCPRVVEDMRRIDTQLAARDRGGVEFVLFSLDPGRDTPAALRRFAQEHHLTAQHWRLFAASDDGVRELSAVLGVKYQAPAEDGQIAHSAMIFVIDRDGVVRHRQIGTNQDSRELTAALASARR